ncbi:unnamed protein product [Ceutorhynchus assimilis]|uniref:Uncharacterized protein n=1 Tax=Ceutorhynchus assimilis TaxID=467358 RepID=A0A9N9MA94_9CUCU|nr:unnamed protein product [Ceutorhynchus assimilis]
MRDSCWKFIQSIEKTEPIQIKSDYLKLFGADFEAVQILKECIASEQPELENIRAKSEENRHMSDKLKAMYLERQQIIDEYEVIFLHL